MQVFTAAVVINPLFMAIAKISKVVNIDRISDLIMNPETIEF